MRFYVSALTKMFSVSDIMVVRYGVRALRLQGRDLRMIKNDRRFDKATPSHPVIKQC